MTPLWVVPGMVYDVCGAFVDLDEINMGSVAFVVRSEATLSVILCQGIIVVV